MGDFGEVPSISLLLQNGKWGKVEGHWCRWKDSRNPSMGNIFAMIRS